MARTGITKNQVRTMRDRLLAEGRYPSADAVRAALGDTGSKSTIHRYLKELASEDGTAAGVPADTGGDLHELIEQLASRVHAETGRRLAALREAHALVLREKDAELAQLHNTVAALSARLQAYEAGVANAAVGIVDVIDGAVATGAAARETAHVIDGFGHFGGLLSNSRSGRDETSVFNLVRAGGRSNVLYFPGEQAA